MYALGLAWLKYKLAAGRSSFVNAARVTSKGSKCTLRLSRAAKSGFCHSGCSCRTTKSAAGMLMNRNVDRTQKLCAQQCIAEYGLGKGGRGGTLSSDAPVVGINAHWWPS